MPAEGVEPTHSFEYKILSLARLPISPHRLLGGANVEMSKKECKRGSTRAENILGSDPGARSLARQSEDGAAVRRGQCHGIDVTQRYPLPPGGGVLFFCGVEYRQRHPMVGERVIQRKEQTIFRRGLGQRR